MAHAAHAKKAGSENGAAAVAVLRGSVPSMYRSVVEGDVDLGPRFDQRRFAKEMQRFSMELAAAGVDASS